MDNEKKQPLTMHGVYNLPFTDNVSRERRYVITAGALVRGHIRREIQKLGNRYIEDRSFLSSQFVIFSSIPIVFCDSKGFEYEIPAEE